MANDIYARVEGRVVSFENNGCTAVIETKRGLAYINLAIDFPLRLKESDDIEFDDLRFIVCDGVIEYMPDEDTLMFVNDYRVNFQKRGE